MYRKKEKIRVNPCSSVYYYCSVVMLASLLAACATLPAGQSFTPTPLTTASAIVFWPTLTESATLTPTRPATATPDPNATPVLLNPCSLLTRSEAASALGEPASRPAAFGGSCIFVDTATARHLISIYAAPANDSGNILNGRVALLYTFGLPLSPTEIEPLKSLAAAGEAVGLVDALITLTRNNSAFTAQPVAELGETAIWVSKNHGTVRQSFMLAARGEVLVGADIVIPAVRDESAVREAATTLMTQLLSRLPPKFTLATPQPQFTATPLPITVAPQPSPTQPLALTRTLRAASPTPTQSPSAATLIQAVTPSGTPKLKPPAFSTPVLSLDHIYYGGDCGSPIVILSIAVVDPNNLGVSNVSLFFRLVNDLNAGKTTAWSSLPMKSEGSNIWSRSLYAEADIPGYNLYPSAAVEYYFAATTAAGTSGESEHYGLPANPLTLEACQ